MPPTQTPKTKQEQEQSPRTEPQDPRALALHMLMRVVAQGAYAERLLNTEPALNALSPQDRGLVTELLYGTLRYSIQLDYYLSRLVKKRLQKLPHRVLLAMRMAAYQLIYLRIPAHAAVNSAVSLVRKKERNLAGLCNAVLRKLATQIEEDQLPEITQLTYSSKEEHNTILGIQTSLPSWLIHQLSLQRHANEILAWGEINNQPPQLSLRVNTLQRVRPQVTTLLKAQGLSPTSHPHLEDTFFLEGAGSVEKLPGFSEGQFTVQDVASQLVSLLLAPKPHETIVDLCAAPGGKSMHLAALMENTGKILACDISPGRLRLISQNIERLGCDAVIPVLVDSADKKQLITTLTAHDGVQVDRVLVDPPCSGLGTVRRHPEIRLRAAPDIKKLCALQDTLLANGASLVKPGGVLVYSVCTFTLDEGEARVTQFLLNHPEFTLESITLESCLPYLQKYSENGIDGEILRTWSDRDAVDSFFAAKFKRKIA